MIQTAALENEGGLPLCVGKKIRLPIVEETLGHHKKREMMIGDWQEIGGVALL